jgi:hypothetical protein
MQIRQPESAPMSTLQVQKKYEAPELMLIG